MYYIGQPVYKVTAEPTVAIVVGFSTSRQKGLLVHLIDSTEVEYTVGLEETRPIVWNGSEGGTFCLGSVDLENPHETPKEGVRYMYARDAQNAEALFKANMLSVWEPGITGPEPSFRSAREEGARLAAMLRAVLEVMQDSTSIERVITNIDEKRMGFPREEIIKWWNCNQPRY